MSKRRAEGEEENPKTTEREAAEGQGPPDVAPPPCPPPAVTAEDIACRAELLCLAPSSILGAVAEGDRRLRAERMHSAASVAIRLIVRMAQNASQCGQTADAAALSGIADQLGRVRLVAWAAGFVEGRGA